MMSWSVCVVIGPFIGWKVVAGARKAEAEGWVFVAAPTDRQFERLCEGLGLDNRVGSRIRSRQSGPCVASDESHEHEGDGGRGGVLGLVGNPRGFKVPVGDGVGGETRDEVEGELASGVPEAEVAGVAVSHGEAVDPPGLAAGPQGVAGGALVGA